jgi:NarL family two-component system response regulator LiaR
MSDLLRILIADDHLIVRRGLGSLLIPRNGMEVVGEAADGVEAVALAQELQPDIILMDMVMPHKDGVTAIEEIRAHNPNAHILVLTSFGEEGQVSKAIKAGALGYLLKDSSPDQLFQAIRQVAAGNLSLPPNLALKLMQDLQRPPQPQPPELLLTERELEVLKGIARGLSNQEIARELSIGVTTVRTHVSSLFSKLGLTNRTQAALYAVEHGLTDS